MAQVKICRTDAVPAGTASQFTVRDVELLIVNVAGRFYCIGARCTHAGAPLADGELVDDVLTCPWHASRFRVTDGTVLRGPAERNLLTYPVSVRDDYVYAEV